MSTASASRPAIGPLLQGARAGEGERLDELLSQYVNYLRLLATTQVDARLRRRVSPSDLVQETLLGAYRDFGQFRGQSEPELLAWLRQILINRLHVFVQKNVLAAKRDMRREVSLDAMNISLDRSTRILRDALVDAEPSPASKLIRDENVVALADALAEMPPQYQEVLVLRNLQGLSFAEVAQQMNRGAGAVRMLWLRAIRRLRENMEGAA